METKVIYHIDDEETPYLIKIPLPPERVTLADFKLLLNRPNFKFFFKALDDDFGVVKEEIVDDGASLPLVNGRVVSWLVTADSSSNQSDGGRSSQSPISSSSAALNFNAHTLQHHPHSPLHRNHAHQQQQQQQHIHRSQQAALSNASTLQSNQPLLPPLSPSPPPPPPSSFPAPNSSQQQHFLMQQQHPMTMAHHYAESTCTESTMSSLSQLQQPHAQLPPPPPPPPLLGGHQFKKPYNHFKPLHNNNNNSNKMLPNMYDNSSTLLSSSDIDSTTTYSRLNNAHVAYSECSSSVSRLQVNNVRKKSQRRRKQRIQPSISRTSSYSSVTDSTMSLNIITVNLKLDKVNFLGISIVGHCNKTGDRGIYVGSIMKGGAVALDGRIEPGDMILQVNNINFENMTNDEAVKVLREVVQTPNREIKLVVAKCWNQNPKGYFTVPRMEPVRPIDPEAWVAHTTAAAAAAARNGSSGTDQAIPRPMSRSTLSSSSLSSTVPANDLYCTAGTVSSSAAETANQMLSATVTDMAIVVETMARPESGLEIRNRTWLKITIPNAFIGGDVVDWLLAHVDGFSDRRDAHKYASRMLKSGYIRHTVNKNTFSEQCYYVFATDFMRTPSSTCMGGGGGGGATGSSGTGTTLASATTMMSAMKIGGGATSGGSGNGGDSFSAVTDCASLPPPPSSFNYQPMPQFYNTSSEQTIYGYNRSEASNSSNERLRYSKNSLSLSSNGTENSHDEIANDDVTFLDGGVNGGGGCVSCPADDLVGDLMDPMMIGAGVATGNGSGVHSDNNGIPTNDPNCNVADNHFGQTHSTLPEMTAFFCRDDHLVMHEKRNQKMLN